MEYSVVIPRLGSIRTHRRRQVAVPVAFSVLIPKLAAVCPHHPVESSVIAKPSCGPALVREGSQIHGTRTYAEEK
jgi:hypothetical protein